jgi:hypothetical protein
LKILFCFSPGLAGSPSIKTEFYSDSETSYALEWMAESITPITAFKLQLAEGLHGTQFSKEIRYI